MNETETTNQEEQSQALEVRQVQPVAMVPDDAKQVITAAQAKIEAIANLTHSAYSKASELSLTQEEITALQQDFPDEAFKPGAAGKEALIYIEHAFLRDRLNQVIGCGRWSLIPRSRWAEDYEYYNKTSRQKERASRVYVEAMLVIRGCFVSESIGDMTYYPANQSTNYGDAVEGAKTAALRRCCKELGIGLQAWKKDWCEGWWQRRNAPRSPKSTAPKPAPTQAAPPPPSQPASKGEEMDHPVCTITSVIEKKGVTNGKPWTCYIVHFNDGLGEQSAGTFDRKLADLAGSLIDTGETARVVSKPGRKEGTFEIVTIERGEQPPTETEPQDLIP